jgi:hypothetical protein
MCSGRSSVLINASNNARRYFSFQPPMSVQPRLVNRHLLLFLRTLDVLLGFVEQTPHRLGLDRSLLRSGMHAGLGIQVQTGRHRRPHAVASGDRRLTRRPRRRAEGRSARTLRLEISRLQLRQRDRPVGHVLNGSGRVEGAAAGHPRIPTTWDCDTRCSPDNTTATSSDTSN